MRTSFTSALIVCASFFAVSIASAQAQDVYATAAETVTPTQLATSAPVAEAPATVVLTGHVGTTAGMLPGAVVKLNGSQQMVVTDADGSFHVTVPANSGPLQATASYAGFDDEAITLGGTANEVSMKTIRIVATNKKGTLQAYKKTARKQAKRSLRKVHKANK